MPVLLDCACGKRLQVNEEHIGKRIRCAECGAIQLVRNPDEKPPAAMIAFGCACGKKMQARAEYVGKTVQCPGCGAGVAVPRNPADRPAEPAPTWRREATTTTARQTAPDGENRDRDRERDEPRGSKSQRGRKRGSGLVWAFAGGTALVLLAIGLLVYLMQGTSKKPSVELLAAVPGDAAGFASVRVADLLATEAGKEILAALPLPGRQNLDKLEQQTGLGLKDVERVTVVLLTVPDAGGGGAPDGWLVCNLTRPVDTKKIVAALKLAEQPLDHKGKKYYAGHDTALCFVDERTLVLAPEGAIGKAIDQFVQPKKEGPLAELTARAGSRQIVAGFVPPARLMAQIPKNPVPKVDLGALTEVQKVYFAAGLRGKMADFELTGIFSSNGKAKEAKDVLESLKAVVNLMAPQPGMDAAQIARARQTLKELNFAQRGTEVNVSSHGLVDIEELKRNMAGAGMR